jgi:hypothetical protein
MIHAWAQEQGEDARLQFPEQDMMVPWRLQKRFFQPGQGQGQEQAKSKTRNESKKKISSVGQKGDVVEEINAESADAKRGGDEGEVKAVGIGIGSLSLSVAKPDNKKYPSRPSANPKSREESTDPTVSGDGDGDGGIGSGSGRIKWKHKRGKKKPKGTQHPLLLKQKQSEGAQNEGIDGNQDRESEDNDGDDDDDDDDDDGINEEDNHESDLTTKSNREKSSAHSPSDATGPHSSSSSSSADPAAKADPDTVEAAAAASPEGPCEHVVVEEDQLVFQRYCHVYKQGELEDLCSSIPGCRIVETGWDKGNWAVLLQRVQDERLMVHRGVTVTASNESDTASNSIMRGTRAREGEHTDYTDYTGVFDPAIVGPSSRLPQLAPRP